MKANLIKLFVLASILVLAVIVIGGINTTSADVLAQGKPPTVALPTRVGTKPPTLTATPTKPGAQPQVGNTPVAPVKATVTRTPTRAAVRSSRAVPAPGGPFNTAFYLQNVSNSQASCNYTFYNASGGVAYTTSTPIIISVGSSAEIYVPNLSVTSGTYSAVVSCDQQVAAMVNYSDSDSGASHSGVSSPAQTWYAPATYDNYWGYYSSITVQNATSAAINITVEFFAAGSNTPVDTMTATNVPGYASVSFEQEGRSNLNPNVVYSAKITGTGNIVPIVNIYGSGTTAQQLYSYNPFASGATTLYVPALYNNYWGWNSALSIQNIGTASTTVTVNYGTGQSQSATLSPNQSVEFYTPLSGVPNGALTGATITSTAGQPIVALVNISNNKNNAASYSGFTQGSTTVYAPSLFRRFYQYNSAVTCQNVGSSPTNITLTYSGIVTQRHANNVAVGGIAEFYQGNDSLLTDGWRGSGTITAGQPIACVINQSQDESPLSQDQLFSYNGLTP